MLTEAEEVIYARTAVGCEAATAPELRFLRTITGGTEANLPRAVRLAGASCWNGDPPTLMLPPGLLRRGT
ncbi:hypothetical protein SAMN04489729_3250 [Amycolatopsis lurida]|uniref:Uncharacterized protein n=1 Tax=Amycolatopsis lurida NRRL 2430 TaxID=1460371 RepID=A0A2P2FJJ9_AMYLU|nr:hypothetical protein [Amycolatopsis lurida]KFU76896.1 hypothetical protein BB31_33695 [Amycolatopsis lurida NRRL 2430]SED06373.1 hypothetical protein SAMN04489729_3250 [Amycolatopsis lurida]